MLNWILGGLSLLAWAGAVIWYLSPEIIAGFRNWRLRRAERREQRRQRRQDKSA